MGFFKEGFSNIHDFIFDGSAGNKSFLIPDSELLQRKKESQDNATFSLYSLFQISHGVLKFSRYNLIHKTCTTLFTSGCSIGKLLIITGKKYHSIYV